MASDHDTLADLIENALYGPETIEHATNAASLVIDAGWRPPAREITTAGGIEALPTNSIVVDRDGDPWRARSLSGAERRWCGRILGSFYSSDDLVDEFGPVTVVHSPTEEGE